VPLGEIGAHDLVLVRREDAVADVLVGRHTAPAGLAGNHDPRPEHGIGLAALDRRDQLRQQLGCVLAVAMLQNDDVPAVLDRPADPHFWLPP
jgi:hypothetical protein